MKGTPDSFPPHHLICVNYSILRRFSPKSGRGDSVTAETVTGPEPLPRGKKRKIELIWCLTPKGVDTTLKVTQDLLLHTTRGELEQQRSRQCQKSSYLGIRKCFRLKNDQKDSWSNTGEAQINPKCDDWFRNLRIWSRNRYLLVNMAKKTSLSSTTRAWFYCRINHVQFNHKQI